VLEGTPKTDSVASAGGASFGVPSVTCWSPGIVAQFAHLYLAGKTVLVLPDADWVSERPGRAPSVEGALAAAPPFPQARDPGLHLRAAPPHRPEDWYRGTYFKAAHDMLGAGAKLGDLMVGGREPQSDAIADAVRRIPVKQRRCKAAQVLEDLTYAAKLNDGRTGGRNSDLKEGQLPVSFQAMKNIIGVHDPHRALENLRDVSHTFTVVDGSMDHIEPYRTYGRRPDGEPWTQYEWPEKRLLTIESHPEYRATQTFKRLGYTP
jgi:hypothetical protein